MEHIFWAASLLVAYIFIGYPILLSIISMFRRGEDLKADDNYLPTVTLIISAHNEEKVMEDKLINCLMLDYPRELLQIRVVSDGSTDRTNEIVKSYENENISLQETPGRVGKTEAQNLAAKVASGEILAFSDANAMWENKALKNLVRPFKNQAAGYVCGKLCYVNTMSSTTSRSEGMYWRYELLTRRLESKVRSVTAGNGAIYAVRKGDFHYFPPNASHDFEFPKKCVAEGKLALFTEEALAYEMAGTTTRDEYSRKVRMMARVWKSILRDPGAFSPFRVGIIYSLEMVSHRFLRYNVMPLQFLLLMSNWSIYDSHFFYQGTMALQLGFYLLAVSGYLFKSRQIFFYLPFYLCLFNVASMVGLYRALADKTPSFWEKAKSTRGN